MQYCVVRSWASLLLLPWLWREAAAAVLAGSNATQRFPWWPSSSWPDFMPVDGAADRSCRGHDADDIKPDYYHGFEGISTIEGCMERCKIVQGCTAVDYSPHDESCKVWTTPVRSSIRTKHHTCFHYGSDEREFCQSRVPYFHLQGAPTSSNSIEFVASEHTMWSSNFTTDQLRSEAHSQQQQQRGTGRLDGEDQRACLARLWDRPSIEQCLKTSWVVLLGGSTSVLMTSRLIWMLGGSMNGYMVRKTYNSDISDFIVQNGNLAYSRWSNIAKVGSTWDNFGDEETMKFILSQAPSVSSGIRITLFYTLVLEQAEAALAVLDNPSGLDTWSRSQMFVQMQIQAWYEYCANWHANWCYFDRLRSMSFNSAKQSFRSGMERTMQRLDGLCGQGGRANRFGCVVLTSQMPINEVWNDLTIETAKHSGRLSNELRLVDLDRLVHSSGFAHYHLLDGHVDQYAATWVWMILLSGACVHTRPSQGNTLSFGYQCSGEQWKHKLESSCDTCGTNVPCGEKCMSASLKMQCPGYMSMCKSQGPCRSWECVHSSACSYKVVCNPSVGTCTPSPEWG
mmetsp:Transcript_56340/g.134321  ORF Transcript_56340/g.134321 Transcript_56340/m.134321 type:complete len:567 (-) Transcript_56340:56-1756(-)